MERLNNMNDSLILKMVSACIVFASVIMIIACDNDKKKDSTSQLLPLLLFCPATTKYILYDGSTSDGFMVPTLVTQDNMCKASSNKPVGATKVHAFISLGQPNSISNMPNNYNYNRCGKIYGPDGKSLIANNWNDLLDGFINMTLYAAGVLPDETEWWSASKETGDADTVKDCNVFQSNDIAYRGICGILNRTDAGWIRYTVPTCNNTRHILCICEIAE